MVKGPLKMKGPLSHIFQSSRKKCLAWDSVVLFQKISMVLLMCRQLSESLFSGTLIPKESTTLPTPPTNAPGPC
jgi:hypothetical protein